MTFAFSRHSQITSTRVNWFTTYCAQKEKRLQCHLRANVLFNRDPSTYKFSCEPSLGNPDLTIMLGGAPTPIGVQTIYHFQLEFGVAKKYLERFILDQQRSDYSAWVMLCKSEKMLLSLGHKLICNASSSPQYVFSSKESLTDDTCMLKDEKIWSLPYVYLFILSTVPCIAQTLQNDYSYKALNGLRIVD